MTAGRLGPHRLSGMVAPMVAWALHFVAVYAIQGLACAEGWQHPRVGGRETVTWWLLLLTVAMLALVLAFGLRAARAWRGARTDVEAGGGAEAKSRRFSAGITAVLSILALIAICFTSIPILLLPTCA